MDRVCFLLPFLIFLYATASDPSYKELRQLATLLSAGDFSAIDEDNFIVECSQEPMELGLVIDASASINPRDFVKGQQFLKEFLSMYDIGPARSQVRVSAIKYGRGVYTEDSFNLNTYKTKEEVLEHVANMRHEYGTFTDTGPGIDYMRTVQMAKTRPWAPKFAVVLTDGNSQESRRTQVAAANARAENITMFAVGVGSRVSNTELLNIAGDQERVIQVSSYDDLQKIKKLLAHKTCIRKPKPTTTPPPTTTTEQRAPECYEAHSSDINFIFSPATLGLDTTSWVTQFISHTVDNQQLRQGFQYGAVTGDCPDSEGFSLNQHSSVDAIRHHLSQYDRDSLPGLVRKTALVGFSDTRGARPEASKIAVIFVGKHKIDETSLNSAIDELVKKGVRVFVVTTDSAAKLTLSDDLRPHVTVLQHGSSFEQAQELVSRICYLA